MTYIKNLTYIAIFAAMLCICTLITIPGPIPFTMQTFALFLCLFTLGSKSTAAALTIYTFLGMIGLPVFSGFKSGFSALFGPTGGYIIGFYFIPLIYLFFEHSKLTKLNIVIACALGMILCYCIGSAWYMLYTGTSIKYTISVLTACVFPFILPDAVKIFLAHYVSEKLYRYNTHKR